MRLDERLPDSVTVGRKRYRLDLDFRNVLGFMRELGRDELMPAAREYRALRCIMRRPPRDTGPVLAAVRELLFPARETAPPQKRLTDFEQDADLIRAAFLQEYGVNLWRDRLHWLEFSALLSALPEGSRYSDVLGIRARPMPKATKYNAEERQWLARAKEACKLRLSDADQARAYEEGVRNVFAVLKSLAKPKERDSDAGSGPV